MNFETIRYELAGPVLTITLNRPEKLNAYNAKMGAELVQAFQAADGDDAVRAVILTGEGRGFCAGADISAGAASFDTAAGVGSDNFGEDRPSGGQADDGAGFVHAMFNCRKPIIAAFNGPAVGVGITMALPTDIKIASTRAKFGFIFVRRGLTPEAASAWFLPQLVGLPQALRWLLEGKMVDVNEALTAGLISEVLEPEDLLDRARAIALGIADNTAPVSIAITRQMLWRFASAPNPFEVLKIDGPFIEALGSTADVKEGVGAFLEKRLPAFPGKVSTDMPPGYPWWGNSA